MRWPQFQPLPRRRRHQRPDSRRDCDAGSFSFIHPVKDCDTKDLIHEGIAIRLPRRRMRRGDGRRHQRPDSRRDCDDVMTEKDLSSKW